MKQFICDLSDLLQNNGWSFEDTSEFVQDFWEYNIEGEDAFSWSPEKFEAILAFEIADQSPFQFQRDEFKEAYPKQIAKTLTDKYVRVAVAA